MINRTQLLNLLEEFATSMYNEDLRTGSRPFINACRGNAWELVDFYEHEVGEYIKNKKSFLLEYIEKCIIHPEPQAEGADIDNYMVGHNDAIQSILELIRKEL